MVDAEDFLGVTETYPKHPLTDIKPRHQTRTDLNHYRKQVEQEDIHNKIK